MSRTVRDAKLETRTARERLAVSPKPHFRTLVPGKLHLGYRRRRRDAPGTWTMRRYLGLDDRGRGRYDEATLGLADDFQDADGSTVLSFADAQRFAHQRAGAARKVQARPATVADAIEDYLAFLEAERKSAGDARSRAKTHILPVLGSRPIAELTTRELDKWKTAMAAERARVRTAPGAEQRWRAAPSDRDGLRARQATVNRTITVLKAALNRAHQHECVADDRAWRLLKPFRAADAARPDFLGTEDAMRLLAAADEPSGFRSMASAALLTGCRYGELCALEVRDYVRGQIAIRESKSGRARVVHLTDEARAFFETLTSDRPRDEPMLLRADGRPWGPSHQLRPMTAACTAAGLPSINFHQLRHTYASLSVMGGMQMLVVATNLGHSNTRMVEKHYGHLTQDYIADQVSRHGPRFGRAAGDNVVPLQARAAKA